jgi:hypothetical protein
MIIDKDRLANIEQLKQQFKQQMQMQQQTSDNNGSNSSLNTVGNEFVYNSGTENVRPSIGSGFSNNNKNNSLLSGDSAFYLK